MSDKAVVAVIIALAVVFCGGMILFAGAQEARFKRHCASLGGHTETANGYKSATHLCLSADGRILDVD